MTTPGADPLPDPPSPPAGMSGSPGPFLRLVRDYRVAFLIVGVANTAIGFGWFALFDVTVGRVGGYFATLACAHVASVLCAFVLYRRFVFRVRGHVFRDLLRFESVYLVALAINAVALPLLVELAGLVPIAAQAIIVVATTLVSFFGHRDFSFRRSGAKTLSRPTTIDWQSVNAPMYALSFLLTSVVTFLSLQLWRARLDVPFVYAGDALPTGMHFKTTLMTGWYERQALLAAPNGQNFYDFPFADNLHLVAADILKLFTSDWAVAMNLYYLVGFPLAGLTGTWFLRRCGVSRPLSVVLGTIFAIAPYHFVRSEGHLFLASYFAVALGAGLLVSTAAGERIWGWRGHGRTWGDALVSRTTGTLLIIVLVATSSSYYAVFFALLLGVAGLGRLIAGGGWRRFWGALSVGVVTVVVVIVNSLPDLIYSWINGPNSEALTRSPVDSEIYAFKLTQLLLPLRSSRLPILGRVRELYDDNYPLISENPSLGLVAAAGFVAAFVLIVLLIVRVTRGASAQHYRWLTAPLAACLALVLVTFLFGTVGGLGTIVGFVVDAIRGWNRIAIFLSAFCLAIVGIILTGVIESVRMRRPRRSVLRFVAAAGIPVALLGIAIVDQAPSGVGAGYGPTIRSYEADRAYFGRVQAELPKGSRVLQLPYIAYPESQSATGVLSSEAVVPFLQTTGIGWSGGGIKGRPEADFPSLLGSLDAPSILSVAAASGFDGILVDTRAEGSRKFADAIAGQPGMTALWDGSRRYAFFSLRTVNPEGSRSELAAVERDVTDPVMPYFGGDFVSVYNNRGEPAATSKATEASLRFDNDRSTTRSVSVGLSVRPPVGLKPTKDSVVSIRLPGGRTIRSAVTEKTTDVSFDLAVPPGGAAIDVSFQRNGTSITGFSIDPVVVRSAVLQRFLGSQGF